MQERLRSVDQRQLLFEEYRKKIQPIFDDLGLSFLGNNGLTVNLMAGFFIDYPTVFDLVVREILRNLNAVLNEESFVRFHPSFEIFAFKTLIKAMVTGVLEDEENIRNLIRAYVDRVCLLEQDVNLETAKARVFVAKLEKRKAKIEAFIDGFRIESIDNQDFAVEQIEWNLDHKYVEGNDNLATAAQRQIARLRQAVVIIPFRRLDGLTEAACLEIVIAALVTEVIEDVHSVHDLLHHYVGLCILDRAEELVATAKPKIVVESAATAMVHAKEIRLKPNLVLIGSLALTLLLVLTLKSDRATEIKERMNFSGDQQIAESFLAPAFLAVEPVDWPVELKAATVEVNPESFDSVEDFEQEAAEEVVVVEQVEEIVQEEPEEKQDEVVEPVVDETFEEQRMLRVEMRARAMAPPHPSTFANYSLDYCGMGFTWDDYCPDSYIDLNGSAAAKYQIYELELLEIQQGATSFLDLMEKMMHYFYTRGQYNPVIGQLLGEFSQLRNERHRLETLVEQDIFDYHHLPHDDQLAIDADRLRMEQRLEEIHVQINNLHKQKGTANHEMEIIGEAIDQVEEDKAVCRIFAFLTYVFYDILNFNVEYQYVSLDDNIKDIRVMSHANLVAWINGERYVLDPTWDLVIRYDEYHQFLADGYGLNIEDTEFYSEIRPIMEYNH